MLESTPECKCKIIYALNLKQTMEKIEPKNLNGTRTYFTGFDNKSYATKNYNNQKEILNKTLKVLLLTKNKIVFGASHLKNDLAIDLIKKEPLLFEKNLIIPSLRNEHNGDLSKVMNGLSLDDNIFKSYVGWDLKNNTTWFRQQILNGFKYEKSILRNNLLHTDNNSIKTIIDMLENSQYFDRDISDEKMTNIIHKDDLNNFHLYQNLVYNTSGARAVNCESSLNQESMIYDYSLSDIENRKTILSDVEIFHRFFVEQVLNSMTRSSSLFNTSFLDALNFKDILDLREIIDNTNFIHKYNELISKSSKLIKQKDYIDFYSLKELLEISEILHKDFKSHIEKEAIHYLKSKKEYRQEASIFEPIYNLVKSINPISSSIDTGKNLIYLTRNVYNTITNTKEKDIYLEHVDYQNEMAHKLLKNTQIDNQSSLIEILNLLRNYTREKYENY